MNKILIRKLARPVHYSDWHDRPLRWEAVGPNRECQRFATKADAQLYAKIRRKAVAQRDAIITFATTL